MSSPKTECRYCGESFTAAGIQNHETYCDENPNPGFSPAQQRELGLVEEETTGDDTDTSTDPHQEVGSGDGVGLPPRSKLAGGGKVSQSVRTDGSTEEVPVECPICESDDTMHSDDARREYESETDEPIPGVVLAYKLSERYCNDCYALWGDEFPEPVPLDEAVGAVQEVES